MKRYRACVIGCSPSRGAQHVDAFLRNPDRFEVVGICDKDAQRLNAVGDQFKLACRYDNAENMLATLKPDVLCFITMPTVRLEMIELGIRHGVKAIAYEKPMTINWPQACAIHRAVTKAGVKTIQSHQHKYGRHWQRARQLIADGQIGDIRFVHATSKGWMLHYASHLMDYSMFLAGQEKVKWVVGHAHGNAMLKHPDHPSPSYMLGRYEFASGLPGQIECGSLAPTLPPGNNEFWYDAGVCVYGTHGTVQVVSGSGLWAKVRGRDELIRDEASFDVTLDQPPYIRELADWLDDDRKVHSCNGERAFRGFEVFMGACLSAVENRRVDLPMEQDVDVLGKLKASLPDSVALPGTLEYM